MNSRGLPYCISPKKRTRSRLC
ncbi:hypothetical protein Zm00014a_036262 [Zea mays]|uniref:Uncharacterized protein n=2 Tax=Zea mays TaxID=4577 RepID=A0A317Y6U6_MAIZE|nr:hypothetical protein Zm00014a_040904 [Zea mays]PWZ54418.1 hypothetical protein Zm00014a_032134 [Zea mays]PWZ58081.1 hypothetical protein Zm00014a_036262 [Zea mays]